MEKIALITGGNSGIGYETAKLFKEKGYIVYIVGRHGRRVKEAADDLGCFPITVDLADNRAAAHIASYFMDGLDVLVNNAALARFIPLEAFTDSDYEEFFTTNLKTPMELIRLLTSALAKRQGCIVNVSSIVVNNGLANAGLYAATKGGLEAFTRSMAVELAARNIRINCVAPGATDTPLLKKLVSKRMSSPPSARDRKRSFLCVGSESRKKSPTSSPLKWIQPIPPGQRGWLTAE